MAEKGSKKGDQLNQQKIIDTFQKLRMDQRSIANKMTEMESERTEHILVMETLKKYDLERRCFRSVGGVLVERKVKDVLPALQINTEQLKIVVQKLEEQLAEKGKEMNAFRLKHNIRIHEEAGQQEGRSAESTTSEPAPQGVLV